MDLSKKQTALLYLDTNGLYFYDSSLANIISLAFDPKAVRDMDIIDPLVLENQIKTFLDQYKLQPSTITIVLSPHITFEKEFTDLKPEDKEETIKKFVDTIPFDNVASREYPMTQGIRVIGCNADMYQELKKIFEKNKSTVNYIIPYQVLGVDQTLIQNLIPENAIQFLHHLDRLKQLTITTESKQKEQEAKPYVVSGKVPTNKTRLYIMGGIFAFLFVILGYMIINMKP